MIGGLVRAYPHPCLALFSLLKYVGLEGECPSAPGPRTFFCVSPLLGKSAIFIGQTFEIYMDKFKMKKLKEDAMGPYYGFKSVEREGRLFEK